MVSRRRICSAWPADATTPVSMDEMQAVVCVRAHKHTRVCACAISVGHVSLCVCVCVSEYDLYS